MGRVIEVVTHIELCDCCDKERAADYRKCHGCGKKYCYECGEHQLVKYDEGVFFSSRDGSWCLDCEVKHETKSDPLHIAYAEIQSLRNEHDGWVDSFNSRKKQAEQKINRLLEQRKTAEVAGG